MIRVLYYYYEHWTTTHLWDMGRTVYTASRKTKESGCVCGHTVHDINKYIYLQFVGIHLSLGLEDQNLGE